MAFSYAYFLCFSFTLHSQYVLKGNDVSPFSIHSQATYVDVGSKELTLEEVRSSKSLTFIPVQQANADFGFTKNHFWIKFQLKNDSDAEVLYFLETARPITDFAELYCITSDGAVTKYKSGDAIPYKERSFNHRKTIFKIK